MQQPMQTVAISAPVFCRRAVLCSGKQQSSRNSNWFPFAACILCERINPIPSPSSAILALLNCHCFFPSTQFHCKYAHTPSNRAFCKFENLAHDITREADEMAAETTAKLACLSTKSKSPNTTMQKIHYSMLLYLFHAHPNFLSLAFSAILQPPESFAPHQSLAIVDSSPNVPILSRTPSTKATAVVRLAPRQPKKTRQQKGSRPENPRVPNG